jgi:hypothetical protein
LGRPVPKKQKKFASYQAALLSNIATPPNGTAGPAGKGVGKVGKGPGQEAQPAPSGKGKGQSKAKKDAPDEKLDVTTVQAQLAEHERLLQDVPDTETFAKLRGHLGAEVERLRKRLGKAEVAPAKSLQELLTKQSKTKQVLEAKMKDLDRLKQALSKVTDEVKGLVTTAENLAKEISEFRDTLPPMEVDGGTAGLKRRLEEDYGLDFDTELPDQDDLL